jgi:membrane associated rhomboid family serine protease
VALIIVNTLAWLFELGNGVDRSTLQYGAVPQWILNHVSDGVLRLPDGAVSVHQAVPWPWTVLTSMFMHGGWLHIIGNMWFLWIFGDNVEDAMGRGRYLAFYLLCGVAAAGAQIVLSADTMAPMVGASGAIAGVLGAYLMLYPRARVRCLWILFILITTVYVPAWLLLGLWFVSQFFVQGTGVAWIAHVGGFITGFVLVRLFVTRPPPRRRPNFPPLFERV